MGAHRTDPFSRQAGLSRSTAWLLAIAAGAGLFAYWLLPRGNPSAPVNLNPSGTLLIGDIPSSTVTLHWTQGGFVRALRGPSPGRAYRFIVCVYPGGAAHDCATGAGVIAVAEEEAQTITRREVLLGDWQDWWRSLLAPRYEYDYPMALSQSALDVAVEWTVGACSEAANTSCTFAEPGTLALTARDLAARRIDDDVNGSSITLNIEVRNDGRTSSESYRLDTTMWEILLQPGSGIALTDVNHADVMASDIVITERGEEYPVDDYRNGTRPVSDARGIYRPGWVKSSWSRVVDYLPPPKPGSEPLLPGACNPASGPDPCNDIWDSQPACEPAPCTVTAPRRPAVYAAFTNVNPGGIPWDFEPADNTRFKNGIYVP